MLGGHSAVEPPVPIPNTEVKCSYADGSATYVCVRVGHCQASLLEKPQSFDCGFFVSVQLRLFKLNSTIKICISFIYAGVVIL